MQNFYPWNIEGLRNWLRQELSFYKDMEAFSNSLDVDTKILRIWLESRKNDFAVPITYDHIIAISKLRSFSVKETMNWLNLKPQHVQELLNGQGPT